MNATDLARLFGDFHDPPEVDAPRKPYVEILYRLLVAIRDDEAPEYRKLAAIAIERIDSEREREKKTSGATEPVTKADGKRRTVSA